VLKTFDVVWFMASTDDADTNRKFAVANQANFPVLADPSGDTAKAYGVLRLGTFAARWTFYIGPDGRIAYIDEDVKPLSAGADAAKRLAALKVPPRP